MMTDRFKSLAVTLAFLGALTACGDAETETEMETEAPAAQEQSSWGYEGETGPEQWGEMSEEYATCGTGQEQSPIDIPTGEASPADLPDLELSYGSDELTLEDTGHGYKATPGGEHTLTIGGDTYRLLQFHAHTPSEHTVDGQSYPMEIHFVHQNDAGELAVVGVMIEEGQMNSSYDGLVTALEGDSGSVSVESASSLLPSNQEYYTYDGSLTTPPCTEGVRWVVMETPVSMSSEQLDVFESAHGVTNRPTLPLGEREVQYSGE